MQNVNAQNKAELLKVSYRIVKQQEELLENLRIAYKSFPELQPKIVVVASQVMELMDAEREEIKKMRENAN